MAGKETSVAGRTGDKSTNQSRQRSKSPLVNPKSSKGYSNGNTGQLKVAAHRNRNKKEKGLNHNSVRKSEDKRLKQADHSNVAEKSVTSRSRKPKMKESGNDAETLVNGVNNANYTAKDVPKTESNISIPAEASDTIQVPTREVKIDYSSIVIPKEPPLVKKKIAKWQKLNSKLMNLSLHESAKIERNCGIKVIPGQHRVLDAIESLKSQYSHDTLLKLIRLHRAENVIELMVLNEDYELILLALETLKNIQETEIFYLLKHVLDLPDLPQEPVVEDEMQESKIPRKRTETIKEQLLYKVFNYPVQKLEWARLLSTLQPGQIEQLLTFIHKVLLDNSKFSLWFLWYDYPFLYQHKQYFDHQYDNFVITLCMFELVIDSNLVKIKHSVELQQLVVDLKNKVCADLENWVQMDRLRGPLEGIFGRRIAKARGVQPYVVEVMEL